MWRNIITSVTTLIWKVLDNPIYQWIMCNHHSKYQYTDYIKNEYHTDSRFVHSQWEMSLQSNAVSLQLDANLESALWYDYMYLNNKGGCHYKAVQNYYYHYIANGTAMIKAVDQNKHPILHPHHRAMGCFEKFCSQLHCICSSIKWSILDNPGQA